MKHLTTLIFSALFIGLIPAYVLSPQNNTPVVDNISKHTVRIVYVVEFRDTYGENVAGGSMGSGVLVNKQEVLTCYHLASDKMPGKFTLYITGDGQTETREGTIKKFNKEKDLLLLRLDKPVDREGIKIAEGVTHGETMYFGGYSALPMPRVRMGQVTFSTKGIFVQPVFFGDSGSGVFNISGELIGIIYIMFEVNYDYTYMGYAVSLQAIREFLK